MQKYSKALVAALGVVLSGFNMMYGNDPRVQMAISVATVLGVFQVRNK